LTDFHKSPHWQIAWNSM